MSRLRSPRRAGCTLALALVLAVACTPGVEPKPVAEPPTRAADRAEDEGDDRATGEERKAFVPAPDRRIPKRAPRLAHVLVTTARALHRSIDEWLPRAGRTDRPPRRLVLLALYEQRMLRALGNDEELARRVVGRLPAPRARSVTADLEARAELSALVVPLRDADGYETGRPEPPGVLLRLYRSAERRFGVPWHVLAAVNYVESVFGRARATSHAGAQGPMQFIPSTWAAYGMGGDVHDPRDAIFGAANYLQASGAPGDLDGALHAYNPSQHYVDAVLIYARRMMRRPKAFYAFYSRQLFVTTASGSVRLTGPGAARRHPSSR